MGLPKMKVFVVGYLNSESRMRPEKTYGGRDEK